MKEGSITRRQIDPGKSGPGNWAKLDAMTDEEIEAAALSDPDAQPLTPEQLARAKRGPHPRIIRAKLGLTQEEAGRIIGGGRRAFQKYESGTTPPSEAAVGLIEILDRHPEELETLRHLRKLSSRDNIRQPSTPVSKKGPSAKGVRSPAVAA